MDRYSLATTRQAGRLVLTNRPRGSSATCLNLYAAAKACDATSHYLDEDGMLTDLDPPPPTSDRIGVNTSGSESLDWLDGGEALSTFQSGRACRPR